MPSARPASTSRRGRKAALRFGLSLILILAAVLGGYVVVGHWTRPAIRKLSPVLAEPGSIVRIEGRNFGDERGESRLEIDGESPTASSYISWSASSIAVRIPSSVDSGLVYVITRRGKSNAKLFMSRERLPLRVEAGAGSGSGPFLSAISVEKGPIGSLLVLSGRSFGVNRESGSVFFSWNAEAPPGSASQRDDPPVVANAEPDLGYELWSDKEIRVRVPDGAVSGVVYVGTQAGRSNGLFFAVENAPGSKRYQDRRSYSISYSVAVSRIQASGPNELYLWVPRPVSSASQRVARVLSQEPVPLVPDYRGVSLYRFINAAAEQNLSASQAFLVQSYAVETTANPEAIRRPENPPPLFAAYTRADPLVPAAAPAITALAKRLTERERNPWRQAQAIYQYCVQNLVWGEHKGPPDPLGALERKTGDAASLALAATALLRAAGIPALPVTGLLVDPSRRTAPHTWVEFYIYGLGWVPMDPVLGSGARPGGFTPAFEELPRYFGNLDNRRIAFSRGLTTLAPMAPNGRKSSPSRPLAFQSFYEEVSGGLEGYSSFWSEVEVTGLY